MHCDERGRNFSPVVDEIHSPFTDLSVLILRSPSDRRRGCPAQRCLERWPLGSQCPLSDTYQKTSLVHVPHALNLFFVSPVDQENKAAEECPNQREDNEVSEEC